MSALAQVDVELDSDAATAAEEDGRPVGGEPRPVGGEQQIRLQLITQRGAYLVQVGRADLLSHLDQEFGIEAELAAAGLAHGLKRGEVDRVLTLVVGGAAAIDAVVAPFTDHAIDDIAMAIDQDGR